MATNTQYRYVRKISLIADLIRLQPIPHHKVSNLVSCSHPRRLHKLTKARQRHNTRTLGLIVGEQLRNGFLGVSCSQRDNVDICDGTVQCSDSALEDIVVDVTEALGASQRLDEGEGDARDARAIGHSASQRRESSVGYRQRQGEWADSLIVAGEGDLDGVTDGNCGGLGGRSRGCEDWDRGLWAKFGDFES